MASVQVEGKLIRITAAFTDPADDSAVDPDTVTFLIKDPDDNVNAYVYGTDPEVENPSVGTYRMDVATDQGGWWFYRVESTGTGQSASQGKFYVLARSMDIPA